MVSMVLDYALGSKLLEAQSGCDDDCTFVSLDVQSATMRVFVVYAVFNVLALTAPSLSAGSRE